jgi:hypothetical protein
MSERQSQMFAGSAAVNSESMGRIPEVVITGSPDGRATQQLEEDLQRRLAHLQEWICNLLIENQQLRMSLHSKPSR